MTDIQYVINMRNNRLIGIRYDSFGLIKTKHQYFYTHTYSLI